MTQPVVEIPRLWAPERYVRRAYDVSRREIGRWRREGLVRARVANRRKVSICVADVERVIARQVSGGAAVAPPPCAR